MPRGIHGSKAEHGTPARYGSHGCRCDACRIAWREYARRYYGHNSRDEYLANVEPPHGTESRYTSRLHRCRCDACTQASAAARAERRSVAAEDRAATVRLYGAERVEELEREANRD